MFILKKIRNHLLKKIFQISIGIRIWISNHIRIQLLDAVTHLSFDINSRLAVAPLNLPHGYISHYNDVIMDAIASQITSLMIVYSAVYPDADQRKHQSSASLAFVREIHRDRWIPRTNGQWRGKCFHLMTSSWDVNVVAVMSYPYPTFLYKITMQLGKGSAGTFGWFLPYGICDTTTLHIRFFKSNWHLSNMNMIFDRFTVFRKSLITNINIGDNSSIVIHPIIQEQHIISYNTKLWCDQNLKVARIIAPYIIHFQFFYLLTAAAMLVSLHCSKWK